MCSPGAMLGVVKVPQLGPLVLRIPLPELVAEGEHPLLRPGLLLVAARAAEHRVEPVLLDRVEQRGGLQPVPAGPAAGLLGDPAGVDRVLHRRDDQPDAGLCHPPVPELEHLGEVVPGVHVHHREREPRGPERALGQGQHHDRVLAAGEQQHRPLELGCDLADDVYRLGLEHVELRKLVVGTRRRGHWGNSGGGRGLSEPELIASSSGSASAAWQIRISGSEGFAWL